MNSLKIVKIFPLISLLIHIACNVPPITENYISCEWFIVCGKNPLDKNCEFCEFYVLDGSVIDSDKKLEQYEINVNIGTSCKFIHYYEDENKLYFFPKDHNRALTIYFDDFLEQNICVEYSMEIN